MDALTGKSEAEFAEEEKADSMIKKPVDTAAQRVQIFGDSMSEYLGLRLAGYANKNGHKLTCITWVSSGTRNWAATDTCSIISNVSNLPMFLYVWAAFRLRCSPSWCL